MSNLADFSILLRHRNDVGHPWGITCNSQKTCIPLLLNLFLDLSCHVSEKGIEVDPAKVKAIQEMPEPKTEKQVRGFLGRLNYIARFISHLTATCEPIFKLLRKNQAIKWNDDCQKAFDKIKEYLQKPPILIPPVPGRPLIMYLSVTENSMGCVLGQHDESGRKEHAIYCLSKRYRL